MTPSDIAARCIVYQECNNSIFAAQSCGSRVGDGAGVNHVAAMKGWPHQVTNQAGPVPDSAATFVPPTSKSGQRVVQFHKDQYSKGKAGSRSPFL